MKKVYILLSVVLIPALFFGSVQRSMLYGQDVPPEPLPVRGLSIAVPAPDDLHRFLGFITHDLPEMHVNTLILSVNYQYQYKSHPELVSEGALDEAAVKKIVQACRASGIRLIPLLNLFGHQSWDETLNPLLTVYPEFDETPWVKMPEKYIWPNADGLYCKSYCPLHPGLHKVIFQLIDELVQVFEADAFHAGMDEVFYIAEDKCPRCGGRDPAELFAREVTRIRDHLAHSGKELWIWGDRLLDGKTTGLGMWEASMNNTWRAVDMIPRDVVICDWHYEQAVPTAPYFAIKGFRVVSCFYKKPQVAVAQREDMVRFRAQSPEEMKTRFQGVVQTVWTSAEDFLDAWYGTGTASASAKDQVKCMKTVFSLSKTE